MQKLVFLDETGAATNMARRYGRCPRGVRLLSSVPWGHWKTTTFVAGLRSDRLTAPCVLDGPMDMGRPSKPMSSNFSRRACLPVTLSSWTTLPSHKVKGIREAIAAAGADVRYLPPYSPDLNPIEQLFAKLKALLRKAAPRTFDDLFTAIADAIALITPQECANYVANRGYRHST